MSLVQLRVELPTYARSFTIQVSDTSTVREIKEEISRTCPGRPRVEGQKLIWRGRFLTDEESVEAIWKSPNEPRVVHLSVHPSAWVAGPPTISTQSTSKSTPGPTPTLPSSPSISATAYPSTRSDIAAEQLPYVFARHVEAIAVIVEGRPNPVGVHAMPRQREEAIRIMEAHGWSWPSILDEPYPEITPGGVKYERIVVGGAPYLSLRNNDVQPTPAQAHALRVLSYTFSILTKEFPPVSQAQPAYTITQTSLNNQNVHNVPHINDLLQQMGLPPPMHNAPDINALGNQDQLRPPNAFQDMPIRPLLAPLFMLILRTSLLLYFVAPTRKPIFGLLVLAWMLYEIWQPIRNNLLRHLQQNEQRAQQQDGGQGPVAPGQAAAPAPAAAPGLNNIPATPRGDQSRALMETLGNMNVEAEQRILTEATEEDPREPGLGHKVVTFFGLLLTTLHPAIWNQRRAALRSREGALRTEVNTRNTLHRTDLEDDEARRLEERAEESRRVLREMHRRRPAWLRHYIARVVDADWVDDAD